MGGVEPIPFSAVHFTPASFRAFCLLAFTGAFLSLSAQVPSFKTPDTACVNGPVVITNTSIGGTTFFDLGDRSLRGGF